jgi:hypothetical protein
MASECPRYPTKSQLPVSSGFCRNLARFAKHGTPRAKGSGPADPGAGVLASHRRKSPGGSKADIWKSKFVFPARKPAFCRIEGRTMRFGHAYWYRVTVATCAGFPYITLDAELLAMIVLPREMVA